jgi:hypothetical protein
LSEFLHANEYWARKMIEDPEASTRFTELRKR